jgi:hypothetical protein
MGTKVILIITLVECKENHLLWNAILSTIKLLLEEINLA